jgi:amidase
MAELNRLTAARAAREIAAGKITCEALVRDCLDRIAERDASVQAWVHCDPEHAIAQARTIDGRGARGVLAGVPVGVKDVIDTCDMPTQCNSPIYEGYRPRTDAACVALARRAGGVVLGKTVTTEFATRMPGPTRNPLNLEHTPGGSSSGSAAAIADWMVPLAFGTQTGGSTIRPAAYCGIVGYKPSFNTINRAGLKFVAESLDTIGVLARTVEDCALAVHALSARTLPDFSARRPRPPRIGFCRTSRWEKASSASCSLLETAAATLARAGAPLLDFALPDHFDALHDEQEAISTFEGAHALAYERYTYPELLSDHLRGRLEKHAPRAVYEAATRHVRECALAFHDLTRDFDVLLTPAAVGEAEKDITNTGSALFNRMWTLLGVPAVTVPAGAGPHGLPLGVQLVGRFDEDEIVLTAAEWVHQTLV